LGAQNVNLTDGLRAQYLQRFPVEAARFVETAPLDVMAGIATVPVQSLVEFFDRVDPGRMRALFMALPGPQQAAVLEACSIRTALMILNVLETDERDEALDHLSPVSRAEIAGLLKFPEGTAGSYMERPVGHFRPDMTVRDALERLRETHQLRVRSLYLVETEHCLAGRVDLQDMALATPETRMSSILHPVQGLAYLTSPRDELIDIFDQYRVDSVPVVDQDHKLIGVVRYTSLIQAAEDEATVDMQKMVGASPDERALSSALFAVRKRLPWLHINLLTAFLAASVVGLFESTIAQFTALAILLPVVAGQSGNAGAQALAVTMRGLALKEVSILHWRRVLSKEFRVGVIDGIALALTCGLGVWVWSQSFGLALVIGIAMIASMIAAGVAGALVPMILLRLGQDPATASSIILTTVTDIAGFMSFLGTATLLSSLL
jgi:magnesium transporter